MITSATDGPFTFDSNEQVDEYRFSISLKILWVDNENENLIEKTFTGFGNYSINNDPSSDGIDNDNDGFLMKMMMMNLEIQENWQLILPLTKLHQML